ncbi:MAG: hypothetical protein JO182_02965 [Acidobacteriaceae bacterium]|nr:hypothetical protein [Acidobacteriaceae bacterium]
MNSGEDRSHDLTRYQGKNLLRLLLAVCIPAGLLYLRLVLGLAATDTRVTSVQSTWLNRASILALIVFFVVQLVCARYVQRLLNLCQTTIGKFLQYVAVLLLCIFFSLTGAIMLEAFGFNVFLRVGGVH